MYKLVLYCGFFGLRPRWRRFLQRLIKTRNHCGTSLLQAGHEGWGWNTLRRDYLAEQFVTKAFNDGLARHLGNDSDPLVKSLDPFQLLPASEDIHQKGLIKGHIVACEMWLRGLKGLQLTGMELARNEDLTYSALKVEIALPSVNMSGNFRLNNMKVLSIYNAKDSLGTIDAFLSGVKEETNLNI